jgi:ABC-type multidrug transport system fused ATPase/permease subunit
MYIFVFIKKIIYKQILDKNITNFNNQTTSTYTSALTNNVLDIENTIKNMIIHKLHEAILSKFDVIIVIKNGKIVESGSYN